MIDIGTIAQPGIYEALTWVMLLRTAGQVQGEKTLLTLRQPRRDPTMYGDKAASRVGYGHTWDEGDVTLLSTRHDYTCNKARGKRKE